MAGTVALVVAAGSGSRAGGDVPKQYRSINGQPMLRHSLAAFAAHPRVDTTVVVIDPTHRRHYDAAITGLDLPPPVDGGATRQQSCCLGLQAIADLNPARVLIHDAARPFVPGTLIDRVLDALDTSPAVLPALPVSDTLKRANDDTPGAPIVTATIDRAGLWRAQTPQGFDFEKIHAAHLAARTRADLTDDAAVAEAAGLTVTLVPGDPANEKVTTSEQLQAASSSVTRTGIGFDVHAFTDGDHVTLGGVRIPHDKALSGHSDADVVLHAITDAILGAIAAGDIGDHFPPSDPQWANADSKTFLLHAADLVRQRGGHITNIDVTVICEAPRIGPHKEAMRTTIAECLALQPDAVAVKATTTEGLGFTGRGEGIAAQAVATVAG